MRDHLKFFIGGQWVAPAKPREFDVIDPATEALCGHISVGSAEDVDRAVAAARKALPAFSSTSVQQRIDLLQSIVEQYRKRYDDIAAAITAEMGAPKALASGQQAAIGIPVIESTIKVLRNFKFREQLGTTMLLREPIGVCGLITPWNWPINQIVCKVAPALAVGCTMLLKPSEIAPFSAVVWTEILEAAGVPPGVFNLINGDGPGVGAAMASHPGIDMIAFTGSTRGGIEVARNAAPSVKRVQQELGGKSPNILMPDAEFEKAVAHGVRSVMNNSGQSCNAPTRMLVPHARMDEALRLAADTAKAITVGSPESGATIGPVISQGQWNKIQDLIQSGIDDGATVVCGGLGKPEGLEKGYYVKPTILGKVNNRMKVAREEVFGPVLTIIGYGSVDEAVEIGNDTPYGLSAYVQGTDMDAACDVASRLQAGQVIINGAPLDLLAPFGGYKQSGNGRERGEYALQEFTEIKAVVGFAPKAAA